jgi:hypothetical protein
MVVPVAPSSCASIVQSAGRIGNIIGLVGLDCVDAVTSGRNVLGKEKTSNCTWKKSAGSGRRRRTLHVDRAVQELRSGPARVPGHLEARDLTRRGTPDTDGPTGGGAPSGNGDIYTECLPRTATTDGLIIATFTPLRGLTPFVDRYLETALRPDAAGLLINANPARPHLLLVEPEPFSQGVEAITDTPFLNMDAEATH